MSTTNNRKPRTHLDDLEVVALHGWIKANEEKAKTETAARLADRASIDLKFPVTENQMGRLRHKMGSIPEVGRGPAKDTAAQMRVLTDAIVGLYKHHSVLPPQALLDLASAQAAASD
jgi:hypothetical protein